MDNQASHRVSWGRKIAYAAPAYALAVIGIPVYVYIPKFYTDVVGVNVALLGYILIFVIKGGRNIAFSHVFGIYAISSGTTLLAAWIPYFIIFTEPWKWWLIGTGMTKSCRLSCIQAVVVIGVSIGMIVCAFRFVLPLTFHSPV